jgi:hypothetical protein
MALIETPFDKITSGRIRQFDLYWRSKRRGDLLPRRTDIDPTEIKDILAHFILADIETPFRVRYRLSGSMIAQLDEEITGVYLDQTQNISPDEKLRIAARYQAACRDCRPVFIRRKQISRQTGYEIEFEAGIWPLSADGIHVTQCAAVEGYPGLD